MNIFPCHKKELVMTVKTPKDVRDFWFSDEMSKLWFEKSDQVDQRIKDEFSDTYEAAHAGKLEQWMDTPEDALALVITLDQFPRNIFRGTARAFESNDIALNYARRSIDREDDKFVDPTRRQFFYLPYMHSEKLMDQNASVTFYEGLGNENSLRFAIAHRDVIEKFGRFPHRNAPLARESTPEEIEYMETHKGF